MPPATRLGDQSTGHPCHAPVPSVQGSPTVFTNGKPNVRKGDMYAPHCCGPACHAGGLAIGSSTVFINGKPAGRQGDYKDCSILDSAQDHSSNVHIGG